VVIYWDSSALLTLLARSTTAANYRRFAGEFRIVTWWGTYIECAAAIARHAREGNAPAQIAQSYRMLDQLSEEWLEVAPNDRLRHIAARAAKNHLLRSGDALQLGAALIASGFEPPSTRFLTEDIRLKEAAEREGFIIE
jgi:predicted nucleic acid-binding protein